MNRPRRLLELLVIASLLLAALLACKKKESSDPAPASSVAPKPKSTGPCPDGVSIDPRPGEFNPAVTAFKDKDYETAEKLLDTMMTKYPQSATVRVWRAEAALDNQKSKKSYTERADAALGFYEQSLKLHDQGCALPEMEQYYLRMGFAWAYLRKKDADSAMKHLEVARKSFANSAEVHYNIARAECLRKDLDRCETALEECFKTAKALKRPKFLRRHYSLDDWIQRSATQSELKTLPYARRQQVIKRVKGEE
jgi:tetratricopeptide (TPR) repeat protein